MLKNDKNKETGLLKFQPHNWNMNDEIKDNFAIYLTIGILIAISIIISHIELTVNIQSRSSTTNSPLPSLSITNIDPNHPDINPANLPNVNMGNYIDADGDGIPDHMIIENNVLYFSKGNTNGTFPTKIPVLKIDGNVFAYCLKSMDNRALPSLLIWDNNNKGYRQDCLGTNESGIPYFGDMQER